MKTGYILKTMYLDGVHAGKEYYMTKKGYVRPSDSIFWEDDCYKTLASAKAAAKRKIKKNIEEHERETRHDDYRRAQGQIVEEWGKIYDLESFVPYAIYYVED